MNFTKLVNLLFSSQNPTKNRKRLAARSLQIETLETRQLQYAAIEDWQLWKADDTIKGFNGSNSFLADFSSTFANVRQADGKVIEARKLVNESTFTSAGIGLTRFNSDGKLDKSFGTQGRLAIEIGDANDIWADLEVAANGDIIVAGNLNDDLALIRFRSNGALDSDFGVAGVLTRDFGGYETSDSISVGLDGSILAVAYSQDFLSRKLVMAKFLANGLWDPSIEEAALEFKSRNSHVKDFARMRDGSLIVVGDNFTTRLRSSGEIDVGFASSGWLARSYGSQIEVQVGADGQEKLWFNAGQRITRFTADGTIDAIFGNAGSFELKEGVRGTLAVSPNGSFTIVKAEDSAIHLYGYDQKGGSRGYGQSRIGHGFYIQDAFMLTDNKVTVSAQSTYAESAIAFTHFVSLYLGTTSPGPIASSTELTFATPNTLTVTAMSAFREPDGGITFYTAYSSANGKIYMSDGRLFWEVYAEGIESTSVSIVAITDRHRVSYLFGRNWVVDAKTQTASLFSTELGFGIPVAMTWANLGNGYKLYVAANYFNNAVVYSVDGNRMISLAEYPYEYPARWTATSITAGDVDGDGRDELYTALQHSGGSTYLYRSTTAQSIGTTIYVSSPGRRITSMTVGDTDGNRRGELFVAIVDSRLESTVYRSTTGKNLGSVYRSAIPTTSAGIWTLAIYDSNRDGLGDLQMAYKRRFPNVFALSERTPGKALLA